MQCNLSSLKEIGKIFPEIEQNLNRIAIINQESIGFLGFCDDDLMPLFRAYSSALIQKVCKHYGWKKRQIMFGGLRTYAWRK